MSEKKMAIPAKVRFKQMVAGTLLATDLINFFDNQLATLETDKRKEVKCFSDVKKIRDKKRMIIGARDKWTRIRFKMFSKVSVYAMECEKQQIGSSFDYALIAKFDYDRLVMLN
jgi:hypothetical protein